MKALLSYFKKSKKTKTLKSLFSEKNIVSVEQIRSKGTVRIEVKDPIIKHNLH